MNLIETDGKIPHYTGATLDTPFSKSNFHPVDMSWCDCHDTQWALHTDIGSLTVLNRMTGFGCRDTESGYRSPDGEFWLASGGCDVRYSDAKTIGEAIEWVKRNANTCVAYNREKANEQQA